MDTRDAEIASAVRETLSRLGTAAIVEVVRRKPTAQVQDVADELLGGVVLEAKGSTRLAYMRVHRRLTLARRKLGVPSPRTHSVARARLEREGRQSRARSDTPV